MKKRYAVADEVPEDCDYLTAGKEYPLLWQHRSRTRGAIEDDDGDLIHIVFEHCLFLDKESWRIVEREE